MQVIKKISDKLKNKSGASLLFVLGVMLLLMSMGASAMIAASSNVGSNLRQKQYNIAILLNDSIHRNIMHSLQPTNAAAFENSLASSLIMEIYKEYERVNNTIPGLPIPKDINLEMTISDETINAKHDIVLSFIFKDVRIAGPSDYIPELEIDRIPKTASIRAQMTVTVSVEVVSGMRFRTEDTRIITTQATYELSGAVLTDDPEEDFLDTMPDDPSIADLTMEFDKNGHGSWSLISYEIIESKDEKTEN